MMGRPTKILLVEDNPGDVRLTQQAFKSAKVNNVLDVAMDGEFALDYLHRRGDFEGKELPDIILLDLNLPRISGYEVLREVKSNPDFYHIPVIVLTTSDSESDILDCYRAKANCYMCKPVDYNEFLELVAAFDRFWLSAAKLPA